MIRSFDFPDVFSLNRFASQALFFDTRLAFTQPFRPFRRALLAKVFPHLHPETLIACTERTTLGFAQCSHRLGHPLAHLFTLSPESLLSSDSASEMIEALISTSGSRQAHYLLAESETHSESYGFLRRAGFAVYARQTIWRGNSPGLLPAELPAGSLRTAIPSDLPAIASLFASVVPALVQQVEFPPETHCGWSLWEEGELVGFFQYSSGPLGSWVNPFFHPSARHTSEWVSRLTHNLLDTLPGPLYVCVRSYQEWQASILQDLGFSFCGDQSVLARRIVAPILATQPLQLPVVEGGTPQVTTLTPPASSV